MTLDLDLASINAKLDRASDLWSDLHSRYGPLYPDAELVKTTVGDEDVWTVTSVQQPHPAFASVLGDCLHNYRSVLDHTVTAIRTAEGHADSTSVQWPNTTSEVAWEGALGRGQLVDVPAAVVEVIRLRQPWVTQPDDPSIDALHALSKLDNIDKHRRLHVVAVHTRAVSTVAGASSVEFPPSEAIAWDNGPLEVGTVFARIPVSRRVHVVSVHPVAGVHLDGRVWRLQSLIWFVDKKVRQCVMEAATAYDGKDVDRFFGVLRGPSGYPYSETNMFDPAGMQTS